MWLLDTVALSELKKKQANPGFIEWLTDVRGDDIHTSVLCLGEIGRGVAILPAGPKREAFARWLETDLPGWLGPRVLPIDQAVAQAWGRLGARGKAEPVDALIGATAAVAGLVVVTRNVRHFDGLGVPVLNPWT
jgi:toxin FitB